VDSLTVKSEFTTIIIWATQ